MGSIYGNQLKISIFGESHGIGVGAVIDGFPAGISVDMAFISRELSRRAPNASAVSTARREADLPKIVSGVLDGKATGAPICVMIENTDVKSNDYTSLSFIPRPGHADYTAHVRYHGNNDGSGGGHFSGRLTAPLVFAGALCKLALMPYGIQIGAHLLQVGDVFDDMFSLQNLNEDMFHNLRMAEYPIINANSQNHMLTFVSDVRNSGDSIGGVVECAVLGAPAGLGSPIFDAVEPRLSSILFSIPAVRGVEFGSGFSSALMHGSESNDAFYYDEGHLKTRTNNHGGILGGITTGMPVLFRTAFKPTPSIFKPQQSVNLAKKCDTDLIIKGRHDPCIAFRAVPVVEAAAAVVMLDLLLEAQGYENFR